MPNKRNFAPLPLGTYAKPMQRGHDMTMVHKVTGKNSCFIKINKTPHAQEKLLSRLQELGLSLESAMLIVEYGALSYQGTTAIMLGNSILAPEDKRRSIAYDALYNAQNMAQYASLKQNISAFLSQFSENELYSLSQQEYIIAQAQEHEGSTVHGCLVSRKDALSMALYDELRRIKGQVELAQRFDGKSTAQRPKKQHKAVSIKEAAQILGCSGTTIKRYDKGEGELAEAYPGRDSETALMQFAARRNAHKVKQRTARGMRNANTGYDF